MKRWTGCFLDHPLGFFFVAFSFKYIDKSWPYSDQHKCVWKPLNGWNPEVSWPHRDIAGIADVKYQTIMSHGALSESVLGKFVLVLLQSRDMCQNIPLMKEDPSTFKIYSFRVVLVDHGTVFDHIYLCFCSDELLFNGDLFRFRGPNRRVAASIRVRVVATGESESIWFLVEKKQGPTALQRRGWAKWREKMTSGTCFFFGSMGVLILRH